MFSQACQEFCPGGCIPPQEDTPTRQTPPGQKPLPPGKTPAQPPRRRLQWTVRILLECFLVDKMLMKVFTAPEFDDNGKFYSCRTQMALFQSSDLFPGRNRKIFIYPCFAFKYFKLEENPNKEAGWLFAQLVVVPEQQGKAMVLDIISYVIYVL